MKNIGKYQKYRIPDNRVGTIDIGVASKRKHHISSLIELDVTEARRLLKQLPKEENYSFTAWLLKCISLAIDENKEIQGIRYRRKNIIVFDDVDIAMMVEREINGQKAPLPYVIRGANQKSIQDIHLEIKSAQNQRIENEGDYVLGEKKNAKMMKLYAKTPTFLRNLIWRRIIKNPFITKEQLGTVMMTSVGMMGKVNGWVVPKSVHPVSFAIGSIIKKPGVVDGLISIRDMMHVTITIDHDVIDGAPAIRVLSKFTKLIESGNGLVQTKK
jgi:pyruvate/2-oxoglutarate dehydrogenase complex dihydrolipoamide acyltransferase (E2) component